MKKKSKIQLVRSEPENIFKEKYTTKSGQLKNRYVKIPNSVIIKGIKHK